MRRLAMVALLALGLAACGSKPADNQTGAPFTQPPAAADKKAAAGPTTTVKDQPDCKAYRGFSFAGSGLALSNAQKKPAAYKALETTGNALKAANPQLTASVDQLLAAASKSATGTATPADNDAYKKASDDLRTWFRTTCLTP